MIATLTKEFKFEAAHVLANHDGKCARLHGHSYRVVVHIKGEVKPTDGSPEEGMVMDFSKVKEAWKQIEPLLDHRNLNETIGSDVGPTTAENIAGWILRSLGHWLGDVLTAVTVYETASSSVTVGA